MTPNPSKKARRDGKIVLDRDQVKIILVYMMGWEPEDAAGFWRLAAQETRNPGCLDRMLRRETARIFQSIDAEGQS